VTIAYTPKDAVLDVVAIALILAPEPVTTPIGIALLMRKRGAAANGAAHPVKMYPDYVYKVDNIRGREITWEVRTIQPGQLPLKDLNRPAVQIKPRDEFIRSRTAPAKSEGQRIRENLPPGVKVHHEIFRPPQGPIHEKPGFIPGETIHHTLRQVPRGGQAGAGGAQPGHIHHTIENSPGYIKAQGAGSSQPSQPGIIHHSIREGQRSGNPANIVKPVRIVEHHTIDPNPPINYKGRLIRQAPPERPPENKGGITGRGGDKSRR
jgi:hypothetical protein